MREPGHLLVGVLKETAPWRMGRMYEAGEEGKNSREESLNQIRKDQCTSRHPPNIQIVTTVSEFRL